MRAITRGAIVPILLTALTGCVDDGWHEGDPIDRAVTGWRMHTSVDDTRSMFVLEPRKIHRDEQGVLTLGYSTALAGPPITAEPERADAMIAGFDTGTVTAAVGTTRSWLLQTELTFWEHLTPSASPPRAPIVRGTLLDRATFTLAPAVTFAPTIDVPLMLGDTLFDLPSTGSSDVERAIVVNRRNLDGGAAVLHSGRGFGLASCHRGDGFVLVYAQLGGSARVVGVRDDGAGGWLVTESSVPGLQFDPLGIACSDDATHVGVVVPSGLSVFEVATGNLALHVAAAQPPAVISRDGSALVATRSSDRALIHVTSERTLVLDAISAKSPTRPARTGDLALFELEAALVVVDVATGTLGTRVPAIRTSMFPFEMIAWRDRFIVALSSCCETTWDDHLEQLLVVDASTSTPLPLPSARYSPTLQVPGDARLFVRVYDGTEDTATPRIVGFDPATATQVSDIELPLCDDTMVLEERGCR